MKVNKGISSGRSVLWHGDLGRAAFGGGLPLSGLCRDDKRPGVAAGVIPIIRAGYAEPWKAILSFLLLLALFLFYDKLSKGKQTTETAADFMHIVEALLNLDGITVEICGSWLWISGNTYRHKAALKQAGCRWASAKKLWYWRSEDKATTSHKSVSMERIREKYGSEIHVSTAAQRPALA